MIHSCQPFLATQQRTHGKSPYSKPQAEPKTAATGRCGSSKDFWFGTFKSFLFPTCQVRVVRFYVSHPGRFLFGFFSGWFFWAPSVFFWRIFLCSANGLGLVVWGPVVWIPIGSPKMKGIVPSLRVPRFEGPKPPGPKPSTYLELIWGGFRGDWNEWNEQRSKALDCLVYIREVPWHGINISPW